MFQLDLKSKRSIYEQIVDGIKRMIISGELAAGAKIPSVRELSAGLTVNPNTIQKAFRTLEQQGWIYTVPGRGSFVSGSHQPDPDDQKVLLDSVERSVKELLFSGTSPDTIRNFVDRIISERSGKE